MDAPTRIPSSTSVVIARSDWSGATAGSNFRCAVTARILRRREDDDRAPSRFAEGDGVIAEIERLDARDNRAIKLVAGLLAAAGDDAAVRLTPSPPPSSITISSTATYVSSVHGESTTVDDSCA